MNNSVQYDKYGIPTLESIANIPLAEHTTDYPRFEKILGRKVTVTEESAGDSMGSEHASYGSSKFYLKNFLPVRGPNHVKSIGDEAASAVIFVDPVTKESITLSYSSESHNGPSFVAPHPGAATGTGGQERDNTVMTGTKVDSVQESRRQCHPLHNPARDPVKQHVDETTKGIADYANAMGIPHGDGAIKFHTNFTGNNLVNVMGVSIAPKDRLTHNKVPTSYPAEKFVGIYFGKASDKTGIGGTKFASVAIDMTNSDLNEKAVQDPDPHLQEANTRGIELVVNRSITEGWTDKISYKDMGAAGLICSSIEQLHGDIGVVINGDLVPQNEPRNSIELLEAETQERNFIYVHEDHAQTVLDIFNKEIGLPHINKGAAARIVGRCNDTGKYTFIRNGVIDVDISAEELMAGPLVDRPIKPIKREYQEVKKTNDSLNDKIDKVLNSINFKSDGYVHDHYDKHVRSTNIVNRGEGAATLRTHELLNNEIGYSTSFDSNTVYGIIDPKFQAEDSLIRGAYKMALVGCSVIGVTNNANYGRTNVPEEMWQFVKGQEGVGHACYNWELEAEYVKEISKDPEIAKKLEEDGRLHVTVNSGNCSLNKANANTGTAIPPTSVLGLVGWTNKPENYATWDLKPEKSKLIVIGERSEELGGSDFYQVTQGPDFVGNKLFDHDYDTSNKEVNAIIKMVRSGYVSAANNIEEGGLCNAVAEMVANTEAAVDVNIYTRLVHGGNSTPEGFLFSEKYGAVLQVNEEQEKKIMEIAMRDNIHFQYIGEVSPAKENDGVLNYDTIGLKPYSQSNVKELYNTNLERQLVEGEAK